MFELKERVSRDDMLYDHFVNILQDDEFFRDLVLNVVIPGLRRRDRFGGYNNMYVISGERGMPEHAVYVNGERVMMKRDAPYVCVMADRLERKTFYRFFVNGQLLKSYSPELDQSRWAWENFDVHDTDLIDEEGYTPASMAKVSLDEPGYQTIDDIFDRADERKDALALLGLNPDASIRARSLRTKLRQYRMSD